MLLRLSIRCLVLLVWTYSTLFISLGASDFRYLRFVDSGSGSGDGSCEACPVGSYADNDTTNCNCSCTCPPPIHLTSTVEPCNCSGYCKDNSSCKECDFGFHANKTASIVCSECELGHFANHTGAINCTACLSGTFSNATGAEECENCPLGTFANRTGMHTCEVCKLGHYCNKSEENGTGCTYCRACPAGTATKNSLNCSSCPFGTFANKTGMSTCEACSHGYYCNETEESGTGCTWCRPCPPGTATKNALNCSYCAIGAFNPHPGRDVCEPCPNGVICNHTGCTECSQCPLGKQPVTENDGAYACVDCIPGKYRNATTGSFCKKCDSGYFQINQGKEHCNLCPGEYFCPYPSSEPMPCPEGAHCPNGSVQPIFCLSTLMEYDSAIKACRPKATLYIIVICVILVIILVLTSVGVVVYCNYCRQKKVREEQVPLYPKEPVKEPLYSGH